MHRGRTKGKHRLAFIAFHSAQEKHAVAIADDGRDGEVRYLGETTIRLTRSASWWQS
jgi:transposase